MIPVLDIDEDGNAYVFSTASDNSAGPIIRYAQYTPVDFIPEATPLESIHFHTRDFKLYRFKVSGLASATTTTPVLAYIPLNADPKRYVRPATLAHIQW